MSYYGQGDYYRGDYYEGDPGLFSTLGSLVKRGVSIATRGVLPPTLGGRKVVEDPGAMPATPGGMAAGIYEVGGFRGPFGTMGGGLRVTTDKALAAQRGRMKRLHPNKSTYVTRGGGTSKYPKHLQLHPKGSTLVPSRRMNVGNGRAAHRAIRRLRGAERMFRKIFTIMHGKRPHGIHPRRRRRRA